MSPDAQIRLITLNSIMFLLIPVCPSLTPFATPFFKFHYVSINSSVSFLSLPSYPAFKFHYVSINSAFRPTQRKYLGNFKFHYVSINSDYVKQYGNVSNPLNSIMFLLIPIQHLSLHSRKLSLNSIMFLLILTYSSITLSAISL